MALTLFSRCEGTTLDGTHDYSAGDTTWTLASGATFSTSGVKVGTNGLYCPTSDDYGELSAASIVDRTQGTVAFWFRAGTLSNSEWLFNLQGTAAADRITIETTTSELIFRHRVNGGNNITLATTSASLSSGNWYFVQAHWHGANNDLRLEVYNSSGTLLQAVENLSAGLGGSPADIIAIRAGSQQGTSSAFSIDNIFIGNSYSDDFLASRDITSYTAYGGGGAAPTITDAGDEAYNGGETGITITGTNFGSSQGSGTVKISPTDNVNDSNAVTQTVTSWSDTSITFTAVRGALAPSTNLYLFVTSNGGYSNASGHVVAFNQVVTVTNLSDTTLVDGQTSITITGTDFQSTQGTGRVVISPTNSINGAGAVTQTVTSWSDTSITFTASRGSLSFSTDVYLFVENDDDISNSTGYTLQFVGTKKLRVAVPPAAAGVAGVYGVVWASPAAVSSPNAGYTFDAAGEKLETAGSLALTDHSFTMFCWIKVADGTPSTTQTAFSIGNSAYGSDRYCSLQLTAADGYARALAYETTSSSTTTASNGCANNTWFAIAGLFTRNTSSQVTGVQAWSWNGTNESLSTAVTGLTRQMSTFNLNRVGMSRTGTGELGGLIAHVAVWNRLLTAGELTQLRTLPPSVVATSNLIAYWPLVSDANAVVGSGINLTATGATLTAGDGPYPQEEQAGAEIGEFTNQSFESSTEGGLAVLKVPVTAFGGSSLTTSDTPVVLVQTSTHTTGLIEATIIEE